MNKTIKSILLLLAEVIGAYLVLVIICSMIIPEADDNFINRICGIGVIIIVTVLKTASELNAVSRCKYLIEQKKTDVQSAMDMNEKLLDKAQRVVDKYAASDAAGFHKEVRKSFGTERRYSKVFEEIIDKNPDMQSMEGTKILLNQIVKTENDLFEQRRQYTEAVKNYNAKIHSLPASLFRGIYKWKDIPTELFPQKEEIVTDEELGI